MLWCSIGESKEQVCLSLPYFYLRTEIHGRLAWWLQCGFDSVTGLNEAAPCAESTSDLTKLPGFWLYFRDGRALPVDGSNG